MRILVACSPGEMRIAVVGTPAQGAGPALTDYAIWREGAPDGLGDVHLGRVTAIVPAMAGAFVALDGMEDGFLPDSAGAAGCREGDAIAVRITRSAQGGKGCRLSRDLGEADNAPAGRTPPCLLSRGAGPLARLAARHGKADILVDDLGAATRLKPLFGARVHFAAAPFDDDLQAELDALGEPDATLPGGMRASIVPTPALVAIDVDGASATGSAGPKATTQFAANRAALSELARQIRLRNLSGAIVIDFAGIAARKRQALGPDLAAALSGDWAAPRLLGFTGLGFAEILRPRHHPPLHELLRGPHAAGLAGLREAAAAMRAEPIRKLVLRCHPGVVAALQRDSAALADLARIGTHPLILQSDPALGACRWMIEDATRN